MKKVLLITDVDFWNMGAGHRVRISAVIDHLAAHTDLTIAFIGMVPAHNLDKTKRNDAHFIILDNEHILTPIAYGERLQAKLDGLKYDVVIIEYIHLSYLLNFVDEDVKMILDMHDIISERTEEFGRYHYAGALPEMAADDEFAIMDVYDHVMVLCQPDREKLDTVIPGKVLLCPHPTTPRRVSLRNEAKNIVYMASEYLPNVDAIMYFMEHAWPLITAGHSVQLHIYGNICHVLSQMNLPPNVILHGYAKDIEDVYIDADVMINPVRFGAGMKIKTLESIAAGVPLVTTPHGARGLDDIAGKAFLTADSPEEFAGQIIRLIEDLSLRERISSFATDHMARHFNAKECFQPLMDIINHH